MTTATSSSAPGSALALGPLLQISMNARDLPRAVAFYRDRLGLRFLFDAPPKMAFFDCGGVRLMLSLPESEAYDHPGSILYFRVTDIHEAHATLQARGVPFGGAPHRIARLPDHDLWLADFRDTEGNNLALMSEVRPPAGDAPNAAAS
ncbi:MAG TPA: VOC family protein [Gemmatimonadaceae bacterium]|nr:VOC family protein [Gemmatimonadaceae bacterium]